MLHRRDITLSCVLKYKKAFIFEVAQFPCAKYLLQVRLELTTSAYLSHGQHGEGTVYKYGALTDCATGAPTAQTLIFSKFYRDNFDHYEFEIGELRSQRGSVCTRD